jgi:hypothetical protein
MSMLSRSQPGLRVGLPKDKHHLPARAPGGHRGHVSYELRALAGRYEITAQAASGAGSTVVELPQGYGLLPFTSKVFDRLGDGDVRPFGMSSGSCQLASRR